MCRILRNVRPPALDLVLSCRLQYASAEYSAKFYDHKMCARNQKTKPTQDCNDALRGNRTPGGSMATTQVTTTPLMRHLLSVSQRLYSVFLCHPMVEVGAERGDPSGGPENPPCLFLLPFGDCPQAPAAGRTSYISMKQKRSALLTSSPEN